MKLDRKEKTYNIPSQYFALIIDFQFQPAGLLIVDVSIRFDLLNLTFQKLDINAYTGAEIVDYHERGTENQEH
jgi:hypothetical protein